MEMPAFAAARVLRPGRTAAAGHSNHTVQE